MAGVVSQENGLSYKDGHTRVVCLEGGSLSYIDGLMRVVVCHIKMVT